MVNLPDVNQPSSEESTRFTKSEASKTLPDTGIASIPAVKVGLAYFISPYFFTSDREEEFTKHSDWIGSFEGGTPSIVEYYNSGEKTTEYHQYGDDNDKFPLIYLRNFQRLSSC